MHRLTLTDQSIRKLTPPTDRSSRIWWDTEIAGFGVRVTTGKRVFVYNYRSSEGRQRLYTIGDHPAFSVRAARDRAGELHREVRGGGDPQADKHKLRSAPTVADLADAYIERHLPSKAPTSRKMDRIMLRLYILPAIGKLKLEAVRRTDIENLHRQISRSKPPTANACHALLTTMFNLAIAWEWLDRNPASGIKRNPSIRRDRYLSPLEISRVMEALSGHPDRTSADAITMLLLTGSRKGEVLGADWSQFDLESGTWTKPPSSTKQRKLHRLPLSGPAIELLKRVKATQESDLQKDKAVGVIRKPVSQPFPPRRGILAVNSLRKTWQDVCREADIAGCRIHDLRHTHASILVSAGLSLPIIGGLLGHSNPSTTARYAHLADDPLRVAAELAGAAITAKPKLAEIIPLPRKRPRVDPAKR